MNGIVVTTEARKIDGKCLIPTIVVENFNRTRHIIFGWWHWTWQVNVQTCEAYEARVKRQYARAKA